MSEKKIITEAEIEALAKDGVVEVKRGMIVTPLARDFASRKGIRLVYGGGTVPSSEDIPRPAESAGGGISGEELARLVTSEVTALIRGTDGPRGDHGGSGSERVSHIVDHPNQGDPPRALVVATGLNRPGIAAALTTAISDCGADIQDISQTIIADFFSMIFVVNLAGVHGQGMTFMAFKEKVEAAGRQVDSEVVVIHEAILRSMHRV